MSRELIESIANGDYVFANELFESRLADIREKKMYEMKRMVQSEAFGGKTRAQAEKEIRARGMTPRKASDVLGDPREAGSTTKKNKKAVSSEIDLEKLGKQWKAAKFGEKKAAVKMVRAAAKKYASTKDTEPTVSKPAPVSDTKTDRVRQSWDRFKTNLTAKMDRKSAMEKKRKEFIAKKPGAIAKRAIELGGKALARNTRGVVSGAINDIGSRLEPNFEE